MPKEIPNNQLLMERLLDLIASLDAFVSANPTTPKEVQGLIVAIAGAYGRFASLINNKVLMMLALNEPPIPGSSVKLPDGTALAEVKLTTPPAGLAPQRGS